MGTTTILDGHPDPAREHLIHALADRYAAAAREAGHDVRRINVADLDVPLLRKPSEFYRAPAPQTLVPAQNDVRQSNHVVILYPLWEGDMPAALKAFMEQVFRPGFAMDEGGGPLGMPKPLLRGKSARIIVTMGMPRLFYRIVFGAHSVKALRLLLVFAGISPVNVTLFGGISPEASGDHSRLVQRMEVLARRDLGSRTRMRLNRSFARVCAFAAAAYVMLRFRPL